jgi:hypothetical protein
MTVFRADGATGRWALYSGTDDAPFSNPRANMSRVHIHSDFDYLAFDSSQPDIQQTISIPKTVSSRFRSVAIAPHGRSGVPFVFAQVRIGNQWVPLLGSVPVFVSSATINGRWSGHLVNWTLELSNSSIFVRECRTTPTFSGLPASRIFRCWISHNIMD